jgi:hypothetical protein
VRNNWIIKHKRILAKLACSLGSKYERIHFTDDSAVSEWAKKAVAIAIDFGLMNGRTDQEFAPQEHASRAEAVVVLKRLTAGLK